MRGNRRILAASLIIVILLTLISPIMIVRYVQLVPNSFLTSQPDFEILGESDEFHATFNQGENNNITLNWTHIAGTPLEWESETDHNAMCKDYIVANMEITWPYHFLPSSMIITSQTVLEFTGDFADQWDGKYMVYSGVMARIGNLFSDCVRLQWFYAADGPSTRVTAVPQMILNVMRQRLAMDFEISIFLIPSNRFHWYFGDEAWQNYTGSISLTLSALSIEALVPLEYFVISLGVGLLLIVVLYRIREKYYPK